MFLEVVAQRRRDRLSMFFYEVELARLLWAVTERLTVRQRPQWLLLGSFVTSFFLDFHVWVLGSSSCDVGIHLWLPLRNILTTCLTLRS